MPDETTNIKTKPTNCAKCNKALRKKIWYYRNGKHYCNKTCWRAAAKPKPQPATA